MGVSGSGESVKQSITLTDHYKLVFTESGKIRESQGLKSHWQGHQCEKMR